MLDRIKKIKNNDILICLIIYISYFILNFGIYYLNRSDDTNVKYFFIISAIVSAVFLGVYGIVRKFKFDYIKSFCLIAFVVGLLFMFSTPSLRGADEELHFYRIYQISEGNIISEQLDTGIMGGHLPKSLKEIKPDQTTNYNYSDVLNDIKVELNSDEKTDIEFPTSALYFPIQYLPQVIGVFIGRILTLNPVILVYLGRLFNLMAYILLMYLSLKNVKGNPLIFAIALLPMQLHLATTLSADAFTNGLTMLFITYIIRLAYFEKESVISKKHIVLLAVLGILISLCKIVYAPLCLLILLIPKNKFKSNKSYYIYTIIYIIICFALNILWTLNSMSYLCEVNEGVNSSMQIRYILSNPIKYMFVLINTISMYFGFIFDSLVGANLCLFDVPIFSWVPTTYLIILVVLTIRNNKIEISNKDKIIVFLVCLMIIGLVFTSLYVQWTKLEANIIDGIQGRYFLPIIPLAILLGRKKEEENKPINMFLVNAMILLSYPVIETLVLKHLR